MKKTEKVEVVQVPEVKIDKSLNQYQNRVIFKAATEKAAETFRKLRFPETTSKKVKI